MQEDQESEASLGYTGPYLNGKKRVRRDGDREGGRGSGREVEAEEKLVLLLTGHYYLRSFGFHLR